MLRWVNIALQIFSEILYFLPRSDSFSWQNMSKKICTNEFLNGSPILAAQNGEPIPLHAAGTKQINLSNGHISTVLSLFLTACMLQKKKTCIIETLVMAQLLNSCLVSPASLVLLKRNLRLHASFPLHHRRSLKDANTEPWVELFA